LPRTFFDKVWDDHAVADLGDGTFLLLIDRVMLTEPNGRDALEELKAEGRRLAAASQVFAAFDHIVSTRPGRGPDEAGLAHFASVIPEYRRLATEFGITRLDIGDPLQGITHVTASETGIVLPGFTFTCTDSHTTTLGGIGALGWGIGISEVKTILATRMRIARKPRLMRVTLDGSLSAGVTAKDMILHLIARVGIKAGAGYAVEFAGSAVRSLPTEGRLTLCNMAAEFAADCGFVAPDDETFRYVAGRAYAPQGAQWENAVAFWRGLATDADAHFDSDVRIEIGGLGPQVSWGTTVQHTMSVDARIPQPSELSQTSERHQAEKALAYTGLAPGTPIEGTVVTAAYIGSCANARLSDLREAASVLKGRKVAEGVLALCNPGSSLVKAAAEAEGLHRVFIDAGFEWLESGCGYCGAIAGNRLAGRRVISSTNRNYEHRQSPGAITHLASPITVAASALMGRITDPRRLLK
jgi:3-isopropylmalate/(R)-2-methylmalate dehydratase large subunit